MVNIPPVVERIPIVPLHLDMGLHNIVVSENRLYRTSHPYRLGILCQRPLCLSRRNHRKSLPQAGAQQIGVKYQHANELHDVFWGLIPYWQKCNKERGHDFIPRVVPVWVFEGKLDASIFGGKGEGQVLGGK
jgi:hypothetical protein